MGDVGVGLDIGVAGDDAHCLRLGRGELALMILKRG